MFRSGRGRTAHGWHGSPRPCVQPQATCRTRRRRPMAAFRSASTSPRHDACSPTWWRRWPGPSGSSSVRSASSCCCSAPSRRRPGPGGSGCSGTGPGSRTPRSRSPSAPSPISVVELARGSSDDHEPPAPRTHWSPSDGRTRRTKKRRRPVRRLFIVTHRWLSLLLGLVLLLITMSGAILVYRPEIQRSLDHEAYDASGSRPRSAWPRLARSSVTRIRSSPPTASGRSTASPRHRLRDLVDGRSGHRQDPGPRRRDTCLAAADGQHPRVLPLV